jgi:hypothetical protein
MGAPAIGPSKVRAGLQGHVAESAVGFFRSARASLAPRRHASRFERVVDLQTATLADGAQITFTFYRSDAKRREEANFIVRIGHVTPG